MYVNINKTFGVLAGTRVLDLSRIVVGPLSTLMLADLGADVIKVQTLQGDQTRLWGPPFKSEMSTYFMPMNRNKRSIKVDLKQAEGRKIIKHLASKSDFFVQNFKPGTIEKLDLDYQTLKAINPELVYCSISGYGQAGPLKKVPAYDFVIQGHSGLMHITGQKNGPPTKVGVAVADVLTGQNAGSAMLAGYINRLKTGRGCHVHTSLLQSSVTALINQASNYLNGGIHPQRMGNEHPNIMPYGVYICKDKQYIIIGSASQSHFESLVHLLQLQITDDPKFNKNSERINHREQLNRILQNQIAKWESKQLLSACSKANIPAGPIHDMQGVFSDQQIKALGLVKKCTKGQEEIKLTKSAISFLSHPQYNIDPTAPPSAGEHTFDILEELKYEREDIVKLIDKKIVG